jgi:hypothetical protein
MTAQAQVGAEEAVRALAAAAAAVRLYPPTSEIPAQAVARFVQIASAVTAAHGPVRFAVEPKTFKWGDVIVGEGQAYVTAFAEALYAHQAGQLIVAPGVDATETLAFVHCAASDPSAAREEGGLRSAMVAAGVSHIAVVELTLRASTEEGLAGLDLTSAPMDAIAPAVVRAAAAWAKTAAGGQGRDEVAEVIGGLEAATRDLATERVRLALLQLDAKTRAAVLAAALRTDPAGRAMDGMLAVIAGMKPATLALLLSLAAGRTGADPQSLMSRLELPPEAARALALMLRASPRSESDCGVPPTVDAEALASDAVAETEQDEESVRRSVESADHAAAATRALATTIVLARRSPDSESVTALGDAMGPALGSGAFRLLCAALNLLNDVDAQPGLEVAVLRAKHVLAQPDLLAAGCATSGDPATARDAGAVLAAAGVAGAEALVDTWIAAPESRRVSLIEGARTVPDLVIAPAGRRLRTAAPPEARDLVALLAGLGDRRAVGALAQALDNPAGDVRARAIEGLAAIGTDDAWSSVVSSITHPDEATVRAALAAIRAGGRRQAVPAMMAALQIKSPGARNRRLNREIIEEVRQMGAVEALPALRQIASRRFVFGRAARELRDTARAAVADLQSAANA